MKIVGELWEIRAFKALAQGRELDNITFTTMINDDVDSIQVTMLGFPVDFEVVEEERDEKSKYQKEWDKYDHSEDDEDEPFRWDGLD